MKVSVVYAAAQKPLLLSCQVEDGASVEQAIENAVPMPTIAASLFARFSSRQEDSPTMKAVAALRNQFGGHAVRAIQEQEVERPA